MNNLGGGTANGNLDLWGQYVTNKDCSRGFCTLYCPQWCYIVFPPPPPLPDDRMSPPSSPFSPLVITIIGVLAAAFLLVSYYAVISKYCIRQAPPARPDDHHGEEEEDGFGGPSEQEPWFVTANGLDEAVIRSIKVFKYARAKGTTTAADCSVCLSEFEEEERLRRLPKCGHAFHVACIDAWLKSHSNCPLCRAGVVVTAAESAVENPAASPPPGSSEVVENAEDDVVRREAAPVRRSMSMDCIREHCLSIDDCDSSVMMKRSYSSGRWLFSINGRPHNSVIPF